MDFIISIAADGTRSKRRARMKSIKHLFNGLPAEVPGITIAQDLKGHNDSRQYIGELEYHSAVVERLGRIKIEVGLREPLLVPPISGEAQTLLVYSFTSPVSRYPAITVNAMAKEEAYAEKVRAALTRREPAIRDYFDLFHASRQLGLDFSDSNFLNLLRTQLEVPGNEPIDVALERNAAPPPQLNGQLKPVLRPDDFTRFKLDEVFEFVSGIADLI